MQPHDERVTLGAWPQLRVSFVGSTPWPRQIEVDPAKYYPNDVSRDLITSMPPLKINVEQLLKSMNKGK